VTITTRVLLCTCPQDAAERIATALLERRLVACVNVVPAIASHYRWKGELQKDSEALLILKTEVGCVERLIAALDEIHPYDVPELLSLPVESGAEPYLRWVRESTEPPDAH
jgi:periplasmic divalent cation tolerance protein